MDCLFCKMSQSEDSLVYSDASIAAFNDIYPQAPTHILIVPKKHIDTLNSAKPEDAQLIGQMVLTATKLAQDLEIAEPGYRLIMNCNHDAGQTIFHIHLHLLGGRQLKWPPG